MFNKKRIVLCSCLLGIGACFVAYLLIGDAAEAHAWEKAVKSYELGGGSVNYEDFIPELVPEDQNFGAIEPLRGITIPKGSNHKSGLDGEKVNSALEVLLPHPSKENEPLPSLAKVHRGTSADLLAWEEYMTGSPPEELEADSEVERARRMLEALNAKYRFFFKHSDPAAMRPAAQFVPRICDLIDPFDSYDFPLSYSQNSIHYARVFAIRAVLASRSGDAATALTSLRSLLHLETMERESVSTLTSALISLTQFRFFCSGLWEGLEEQVFDAEQLEFLQREMAKVDRIFSFIRTLRIEAAIFQGNALHTKLSKFHDPSINSEQIDDETMRKWCAEYLTIYDNTLIQPLIRRDFSALILQYEVFRSRVPLNGAFPENPLLRYMHPLDMGNFAAQSQAISAMAVTSCALERYHLAKASYPDELSDLVPDFIDRIPDDPIDRNPIRYRATPDGRYMLYSIGWDFEDNGGQSQQPEPGRKEPGDWVWTYSPPDDQSTFPEDQ